MRDAATLGPTLPVDSFCEAGSWLSVLDMNHLGFALPSRSFARPAPVLFVSQFGSLGFSPSTHSLARAAPFVLACGIARPDVPLSAASAMKMGALLFLRSFSCLGLAAFAFSCAHSGSLLPLHSPA